jgi:hypothetical protein
VTALEATHGSLADVLVNGNVVSQYFSDFTMSDTRDKSEVSAFKSTFKSYVAGLVDSTGTFSGFHDPNIDLDLYTYMTQLTAYQNMWFYAPEGATGSGAAGNVGYSISAESTKYEIKSAINSANTISAEVQMSATGGGIDRGIILSPYVTQSGTGHSTSNNFGSTSTTNGGVLTVHCFSDTSTLVVDLQDSADNSTFANVTGFQISPTDSTIASYRYPAAGVATSGTIRQYTRISWTGSGTFLAMFSRK